MLGRIEAIARCAAARIAGRSGQSTVEAAFLVPILFGMVLLLAQPGILLYDRIVMQAAAMEGCRLLATSSATEADGLCEDYVRRRLGSVPPLDQFHVHEGGCTWEIGFSGNETSESVEVTIATAVEPLPLIDFACRALGATDGDGNLRVEVRASMPTQPAWALEAAAGAPVEWVGAWAR